MGILLLSQHIELRECLDLIGTPGFGYLLKDRVLQRAPVSGRPPLATPHRALTRCPNRRSVGFGHMAALQPMPRLSLSDPRFAALGASWQQNLAFSKKEGMDFGSLIDRAVGEALAVMLGGIPVVVPNGNALQPSQPDCVEVGPVRIVGGVRPQNFDVGYRPDGVRVAFDSKTLNDDKSVGKNWQNMVNDLATEATTVHSRFPSAVVGFIVAMPKPCLPPGPRTNAIVGTLTRLGGRMLVDEPAHRAEAMSLVAWDPATGRIDTALPDLHSPLRVERFSDDLARAYQERFQGLPPHAT